MLNYTPFRCHTIHLFIFRVHILSLHIFYLLCTVWWRSPSCNVWSKLSLYLQKVTFPFQISLLCVSNYIQTTRQSLKFWVNTCWLIICCWNEQKKNDTTIHLCIERKVIKRRQRKQKWVIQIIVKSRRSVLVRSRLWL